MTYRRNQRRKQLKRTGKIKKIVAMTASELIGLWSHKK